MFNGSLKTDNGCLGYTGCRGLPLLVVGGETPARANDKDKVA